MSREDELTPERIGSIRRGVEQAHAGLARPVDLSGLEDDRLPWGRGVGQVGPNPLQWAVINAAREWRHAFDDWPGNLGAIIAAVDAYEESLPENAK